MVFPKFTGNHLCQSLFFNKFAGLRLQDRCFAVDFAKILRAPFLQNISGLLLKQEEYLMTNQIATDCFSKKKKKKGNRLKGTLVGSSMATLFMKSVQIRSFPGPYFPVFGLNTEISSVNFCIQSKYGKIRTRKLCIWTIFTQ